MVKAHTLIDNLTIAKGSHSHEYHGISSYLLVVFAMLPLTKLRNTLFVGSRCHATTNKVA